jgi:flagellar biosynthesis protein FlhG
MIGQAERLLELNNLKKREDHKARIINFSSGKGGTGKTFAALNIARILSSEYKVLYIDPDLNSALPAAYLDFSPEATLRDFVRGKKLFREVLTRYSADFYIIPGAFNETEHDELSKTDLDHLFAALNNYADNFDLILLDTIPGSGQLLFSAIEKADFNILVTCPDPASVMDAYYIIKYMEQRKYKGEHLVIVNKYLKPEDAETAYLNIKTAANHFLKRDTMLLGCISYDEKVIESAMSQNFLKTDLNSFKAGIELLKTAENFVNYVQLANIKHPSR